MKNILDAIEQAGGTPLFVGGCVRDELLGLIPKDIDVEVYNLPPNELVSVLSNFGKVDQVGVSFGVIKLTTADEDYDFSLPRRDNKVGKGHQGFSVEVDHTLTPEEAAKRRDFTINSVSKTVDGKLIDPFGGANDLRDGILKATSHHFVEDPLRVLRGFQFAGRFNMRADDLTIEMCRQLNGEYNSLSQERILGEWIKWALKSRKPSAGLKFLQSCGWLEFFPELKALVDLPQDNEWHPEGCAWTHTLHVVDEAALIAQRDGLAEHDKMVLIFAALCHDLGKATTTDFIEGRWRSPGHAQAGVELTQSLMERIGFVGDNILRKTVKEVQRLVAEHMAHLNPVTDRSVRRLANRIAPANILQLVRLIEADHRGRPPLPRERPENAEILLTKSAALNVSYGQPDPIVMGRHLIQIGMEPGPQIGETLKELFEKQLDGEFSTVEEGLCLLK